MKTLAIILLAFGISRAEIKNGYANEITSARVALENLSRINYDTLSVLQKTRVMEKINTIRKFISMYEITEMLLNQFKEVAPEMYEEIDGIRDRKGRSVDVYVRFIFTSQEKPDVLGATYLDHSSLDEHMYVSDYGENTVSVRVLIIPESLSVLAHELGHVKYQVPNVSSYIRYHRKNYRKESVNEYLGHHPTDPSGNMSMVYEERFKKKYSRFLLSGRSSSASNLYLSTQPGTEERD